jgi:hypothetical protein
MIDWLIRNTTLLSIPIWVLKGGNMVDVLVKIREVATGKEVDYKTEVEEQYADGQSFYYEMGNGRCDCNRKLMFGQAQGIEFSDEETPCGNSRYLVQVVVNGGVCVDEWITEVDRGRE